MAEENFLTYPETDPNSRITVIANRVTWAGLTRGENAWVVSDKGANYFNGNFVHLLTVKVTASVSSAATCPWLMANAVDDWKGLQDASESAFAIEYVNPSSPNEVRLYLYECDGGTLYQGDTPYYVVTINTVYYLKIVRDETVGFGNLYCYIYSDAARTTQLALLSIALHTSAKDFRYIYAVDSKTGGTTQAQSGYTEDLILEGGAASVLPEVTTQAPTSITPTTATGNGIITSLGLGSVTQHGHCWNTTGSPTTADSKTTNGAGAVGAFTSSITGLTAGTRYYVRAYATNSYGTAYGQGFSFIAGDTIVMMTGNIAVVQSRLHYIDSEGVERYIEGTIA